MLWANFRRCGVALSGRHPRSARHESVARTTGCFGTHVSALVPTSPRPPAAPNVGAEAYRLDAYVKAVLVDGASHGLRIRVVPTNYAKSNPRGERRCPHPGRCEAKRVGGEGPPQRSMAGAAPYSSSVTCSPQAAGLPESSGSCIAMWVMKRFGVARASGPRPARRIRGLPHGSPLRARRVAGRAPRPR